jgi:FKBP-type peptidyl-prolyl cis-trans isomerase 2
VIERLPFPRFALIIYGTRRTVVSRRLRVDCTAPLPTFVRASVALVLATLLLTAPVVNAEDSKEENAVIEAGSTVGIEYTLTLEDGTQVDTNVGGDALRFEQGAGRIIPGLDKELPGMKVGEAKRVTITPEEGYGQVDPSAFTEVPLGDLPEDAREVGMLLVGRDAQGNARRLRVHKIEGEQATLDFNHPLAGKTLIFDVKILEIQ